MTAKITFFPVDNGDMSLVQLADERQTSLLIDCRIRAAADDPNDTTLDVASELRKRIGIDRDDRPFVDAMLLSHPDEDHCLGLVKHFWLGSITDYPDDNKEQSAKRIIIRELWSSPMVFRRRSKNHTLTLCPDAEAWGAEARRRVRVNLDQGFRVSDGDRIRILGEDKDGKTDSLGPVLTKQGEAIQGINGEGGTFLTSSLLAPFKPQDARGEEQLSKNDSSVIINFSILSSPHSLDRSNFLVGGDAGVCIWERIWGDYNVDDLRYDLLLAPHHCSWHTLSHDSWSDHVNRGEKAEVSDDARSALAQANSDAFIVSSSKPVKNDDVDPPCIGAKSEYGDILGSSGIFLCTGETPTSRKPQPMEFKATSSGFTRSVTAPAAAVVTSATPPRAGCDD